MKSNTDNGGKPDGIQACRPRTVKELEAALSQSAARLKLLGELLPVSISYIDRKLISRFADAALLAFSERSGIPADRIIDGGAERLIDGRLAELLQPELQNALAGERVQYEYQAQPDDADAARYKITYDPQFDALGQVEGIIVVREELTGAGADNGTKLQTQPINYSTQRQFHDTMDRLDAGFALWDADAKLLLCNSYFQGINGWAYGILEPGLGYNEFMDQFADTKAGKFIEGSHGMPVGEIIGKFYEPVDDVEIQWGTDLWYRVRKKHLEDGSLILFLFDISSIKHRELQLNVAMIGAGAASQAKTDFLANMSHELRTPLNAVIGYSDSLLAEIFGPLTNEKQKEYVISINEAGQQLKEIVDDVLDFSAMEADQVELQIVTFDFAEVAAEIMALMQPRALDRGVELENLVNDMAMFTADRLRVKQILNNLLSNAIKFTLDGGLVVLSAKTEDDGAFVIYVRDTGIGMSDEELEKAMSQFGQSEGAMAKNNKGTGLGLPLTKGLVKLHGGELHIESVPNEGTVARVRFPASPTLHS